MTLSAFDLYSIGIGPSSSHTVGPMRASAGFVRELQASDQLAGVARVCVQLFGSLGATGHGHGSAEAVILGLHGEDPATVDVDTVADQVSAVRADRTIALGGAHRIGFDPGVDLILHRNHTLPAHPNGMRFTAFDSAGRRVAERTSYSVGGGFVVDESALLQGRLVADDVTVPHPFRTAEELLAICSRRGLRISDVMLANEQMWRDPATIRSDALHLWQVMQDCVSRGCQREGVLPGGLGVRRRAPALHRALQARAAARSTDPLDTMDWVNLYALAVNEENAAGGRVVTAPTNGAAGIIPAVLHHYVRSVPGADDDGVVRFLLTAAAIGILFKVNASISGAEVGCQGEVGSACAMAAGALCEVLGGTPEQVENAAEVGIEHNLGLTCDPVGGLVQVPCIERNAVASVKAINAARLARHGDGTHRVTLDQAIRTMRDTGRDMQDKYKETARGGLAVNVIEC
ncbi:L-serine ammonia-lyase [Nakamurella leprariae]|uniref:L-serine dehydratase n=1 Tax=Nakamurella leprariae TaxID=2803911 RepID=A0A939C2R8_9ACTN|nr:L-serine ammonia-lyase [Nakamurella leprariae]MBM9468579.1 L-serine ammonia-lyase [Nakamurella leprariae]